MPATTPYISRLQTDAFLQAFADGLKQPEESPVVFHVWGIGGVGKSTLTRKVQEAHPEATFASVSFGLTEEIETPIKLMAKLYDQVLPKEQWSEWSGDSFGTLYEQYWDTIHKLETEPVSGKGTVGKEQTDWTKQILRAGAGFLGHQFDLEDEQRKQLKSAADTVVDVAAASLSLNDSLKQFLQQHKATRKKKELQALMLDPIPRLTEAFVEGLQHQAQSKSIVLIFDTYEKVSSDIDLWLWRSLLGNQTLQPHAVRLVVAGRHCVLKTEGWRKLNQDRKLVYEQTIPRFDEDQTRAYLTTIDITDSAKIEQVFRVTKGLPYYLDWIRKEKEKGNEPDFSQGNEEIVNLLLQGLNPTQKRIVQYAACCRSFDRKLIQHLMEQSNIDFATAADEQMNCFGWLVQRSYVELVAGKHRLDDVARDVFRLSLHQDDPEVFEQTNAILADYLEAASDREVPPDGLYSEKYNNPDWRKLRADWLYYLIFSRSPDSQLQFRSHLLEARHFGQDDVAKIPMDAISAEFELEEHKLVARRDRKFLSQIRPAVEHGWAVLEEKPIDYPYNLEKYGLTQQSTDQAVRVCLQKLEELEGLAKFVALYYQSQRCAENHALEWLERAQIQAETLITTDEPDFSSGLFLWNIGSALYDLGRKEEAIASYDKALEFKPDLHEAWYNRGVALSASGRTEEAIASYDKALEFKPDKHEAWHNRGVALADLGRTEEAIASYDQALDIKPDKHEAWYNRGNALADLGRTEEAIASYDQALDIKPDKHEAWHNRGVALADLGRIEEAIASYDQALDIKPDYHQAWGARGLALAGLERYGEAIESYNKSLENNSGLHISAYLKACCYALWCKLDEAIPSLHQAIQLDPKYREQAKTDSDFDAIRTDPRFQDLVND